MRKVRRKKEEAGDLEITSFLNLMIILVPFLLLSAAFSQLAILQLNLPSDSAAGDETTDKKELNIEVIVRAKRLEIGDGNQIVKRFNNKQDGSYDFIGLQQALIEIKSNFPDKLDAQILMEESLIYEILIQTMDAVSIVEAVNPDSGEMEKVELFPNISIGDAP